MTPSLFHLRLPLLWSLLFIPSLLMAASDKDPLEKFRWQQRLLVEFVSAESTTNAKQLAVSAESTTNAKQLAQQIEAKKEGFADRKLLLISISEEGELTLSDGTLPDPTATEMLRTRLNPKNLPYRLLLIGKDGGVKWTTENPADLEEVFAQIDRMPMRQAEIRRRKE